MDFVNFEGGIACFIRCLCVTFFFLNFAIKQMQWLSDGISGWGTIELMRKL